MKSRLRKRDGIRIGRARHRERGGMRFKRVAALLIVVGVIGTVICLRLKVSVESNLESVASMKAEVLVSRAVNRALTEQFKKESDQDGLFIVRKDDSGKIEMVEADSGAINVLLTELAENLQQEFTSMEGEFINVPVGSLLGSKLFLQASPSVKLNVVPLSVLSTDFKTELEAQAINQTKYKIYIVLKCRVKVIAPFCSDTFNTSTTVLLAETVILGEVPDSYIQVPQEDVLDAT